MGELCIIVGLVLLISELQYKIIMKKGYRTQAIVVEYNLKRMRGNKNYLDYPLVEYYDKNDKVQNGYVRYAKSSGHYFSIGQKIEIVISSGEIYYKKRKSSINLIWITIILVLVGIVKMMYDY